MHSWQTVSFKRGLAWSSTDKLSLMFTQCSRTSSHEVQAQVYSLCTDLFQVGKFVEKTRQCGERVVGQVNHFQLWTERAGVRQSLQPIIRQTKLSQPTHLSNACRKLHQRTLLDSKNFKLVKASNLHRRTEWWASEKYMKIQPWILE